jgi:type VI secretion system secreted protein VgrG
VNLMGRTRLTFFAERRRRRPQMESLEPRTLLSTTPHHHVHIAPHPASAGTVSVSGTNVDQIVGASLARSAYHVDGTGSTVAVIDTGVNYNHEALGGGFGPGHKVVTGYDFADQSPDPNATTSQHGTAVAGLLASGDPARPGVAPGADIAALRVFGTNNQGDFNTIANALQWVIDNHNTYHITAVNLSLSDGNNYTRNLLATDGGVGQRLTTLVGTLDALNIPVVTADGNSFNGQQGVGFPAIIPDSINVTATDASDHLVSNAQRLGAAVGGSSATDVAAPGQGEVAPVEGNNFTTVDGTSFAAPVVTGAVVLLQQIYESRFGQLPSVNQLKSWLEEGADPVNDPATGITIGRLDVPKAASFIPGAPAAPQLLTPPPAPPAPPAPTLFVNGQSVGGLGSGQGSSSSNLLSVFSSLFQSFQSWSAQSGSSTVGPTSSSLKFWGPAAQASSVGAAHPTGVLAPTAVPHLPAGPLSHVRRSPFVRTHRHR